MKPIIKYYTNGQVESESWENEFGEYHRLDGPSYRRWYTTGRLWCESWRINGTLHRLDGPAFRSWYDNGQLSVVEWYINGVEYDTESEFLVAVDLYKANDIAELF